MTYIKYPRTVHLRWSLGINDQEQVMTSTQRFINKRVIVTEKMDGESCTMYNDYIHARSIDSPNHESRNWVKKFWSQLSYNIPAGWRVCGENLYAKHSIAYKDLPSYFMGFSVWNENSQCLAWDDTLIWFDLLGITPVPTLFDNIYNEQAIRKLFTKKKWDNSEGYVLRLADQFDFQDFQLSVGKYVRKDHVQKNEHWMYGQAIEPNKLKGK